ncbi:hypothetical protein KGF56_004360 [Candida oxycetoniae]|uniref:Pheromone-regulated membrane protein 5 n=1 Tax=Candida oxycetoniae TaxID=497107 RepID=A0AAI9SUG0_9ASCO|nr:uncharacterized protein KGF56_004360 [Candida oxycetoniae]KAI3402899.2 hypothetical protein KGF56_004360 [Candida oxycetoniae]
MGSNMVDRIPQTIVSDVLEKVVKRDDSNTPADLSSMPALSSVSSQPSLEITSIPNLTNPYIHKSNLPSGLVFIIVGCILGAMLIAVIIFRITTYFIYSSKARREKETYFANDNNSSIFFGDVQSNTYTFPYSKSLNASSISISSSSTNSQGKSLQGQLLSDKKQFRRSMFQNPSLDLTKLDMMLGDGSNINIGNTTTTTTTMYKQQQNNNSSLLLKSFADGSSPLPFNDSNTVVSSYNGSGKDSEYNSGSSAGNKSTQTTLRPPTLYLEDLLNKNTTAGVDYEV